MIFNLFLTLFIFLSNFFFILKVSLIKNITHASSFILLTPTYNIKKKIIQDLLVKLNLGTIQNRLWMRSYRIMMLHNDLESLLNIWNKDVSIFNINTELSFDGFMDLDWGFDINVSSFISPVGHETDWDALL